MYSNPKARVRGLLLGLVWLGLSCGTAQVALAGDVPVPSSQQILDSGESHNCGIREDATLLCWPYSTMGPAPTTGRFIAVSVGHDHVCALRSNGAPTCWGAADSIVTPPAPGPFVAISTGKGEACALRPNGRIACWGGMMAASAPTDPGYRAVSVADGRGCAIRGDGSIECWAVPGTASLGADPAGRYLMVDTGNQHACAVAVDGQAICWGANDSGQSTPPATDRFATVTVGQQHSCGLREDGTIRCWGLNDAGQLDAPSGRFTTLTAGRSHTCARTIEGYTQCWGGTNQNNERIVPRLSYQSIAIGGGEICALDAQGYPVCLTSESSLRPPMRRYKALSFGPTSACGVGIDDRLVCWGASLGETPTEPVHDVSVGHDHACARRTYDLGFVCWGDNARGQTMAPLGRFYHLTSGNGFSCGIRDDYRPFCWGTGPAVTEVPPPASFYSISAHDGNVCAIGTSNTVRCWGEDAASLSLPAQGQTYSMVSLGARHACARYGNNGNVTCWGDNNHGQLAAPASDTHSMVVSSGDTSCAISTGTGVTCWGETQATKAIATTIFGAGRIGAGTAHTCQSRANGGVSCWGDNSFGQATPLRSNQRGFDVSGDHGCAIAGDGALRCWGDDTHGGSMPPAVPVRTVDVGQFNGCAVAGNGDALCWGWNANDQGVPPQGAFRMVATGLNHSCGIRDDGTLACWGYAADGQTSPPAGQFTAVDVGERHSCAIADDGTVQCWGLDTEGQATPPDLSGATYRAISTGGFHTCGITAFGNVVCWGRNDQDQAVAPLEGLFVSVAAGFAHSCAIRDDGVRQCWGRSAEGQFPVPAITPGILPQASHGVPYQVDFRMTASSYSPVAPRFRLLPANTPSGLSLDENGRLSGTTHATPGNYAITVMAKDENGFVATRTYPLTVVDVTPPIIRPLYDGWLGGGREWHTADVTLSWQIIDSESAVTGRVGCDTVLIDQDTNGTTFECVATSAGGTSRHSVIIRRDTVPPDTNFDRAYPSVYYKDTWGANRQPIEFGFVASADAGSGFAGFECAHGDSPAAMAYERCPSPVLAFSIKYDGVTPPDGRYRFNVRAKDQAGNVDPTPAFHDFYIRVDSTRPVVTPILTGTLGDNGWYVSDIQLRWRVEDPETPITIVEGCVDEVIDVDGASMARRCEAQSLPGVTLEFVGFKRDTRPPAIYALTDAVPNAAGWHRQDVRVGYTCSDMTSGLAAACPGYQMITQEGRNVSSATRTIRDNAGLSATSGVITVNLDKTPPVLLAAMPPAQVYLNATHDFLLGATDALSGVASQGCTGFNTETLGTRVATCSATDHAGNVVSRSAAYTVIYNFVPQSAPLSSPSTVYDVLAPRSVPFTWRLIDANGAPITNATLVQSSTTVVTCPATSVPLSAPPAGETTSYENFGDGRYRRNWWINYGGSIVCLRLNVTLNDGVTRSGFVRVLPKSRPTGGPQRPVQSPLPGQRPVPAGRPVPGALRPVQAKPRSR